VGNIAQDVLEIPPLMEHEQAENEFSAHKSMTVEEANQAGRIWREKALDDWNQGVRERHVSRAESKRIAESKMFPQFIKGVINPYWETFQHCEFEAQEGLIEMGLQLQRSKIKTLKNCTDPLFGSRVAADEAEIQRRKVLAEKAKISDELLKSTHLVMDLLHWRASDLRLAEQKAEVYKGEWPERYTEAKKRTLKKCRARLAQVVKPIAPDAPEPSIGLLPTGKKNTKAGALKQTRAYELEGMDLAELEDESTKNHEVGDPEELYYLCNKVTDAEFEAEAENAWELCGESGAYSGRRSIRRHVYANDIPLLGDMKKQQLLNEVEALRDKDDWILDQKHVYRRSVLKASSPSWAEPMERMERHYRPIRNPSIFERDWRPPMEEQVWAFPKSTFADGEVLAKDLEEFMTDIKNIASNLRRKNNLSALGLDGIGYLMLELGALPQLEFLQQIFKACIKYGRVTTTWKRLRTVFLFEKGKELAAPKNWTPITITSCIY
jgi:hypothetical protein